MTIQIDALLADHAIDVLRQPAARARIAQVQQALAVVALHPVRAVGAERGAIGRGAGLQIPVAPRAVGVLLDVERFGGVVARSRRPAERDLQARRIADVAPVAVSYDEIQGLPFFDGQLLLESGLATVAVDVDEPLEERAPAVQDVDVGRGLLVNRQKYGAQRIAAGLGGRPADHAVLAVGARMKRQASRRPTDLGHRACLRRRVVGHAGIGSAQLLSKTPTQTGQRMGRIQRRLQQPLGPVLVEPGIRRDALRLEPHHDLHALGVGMIADRLQASRKTLRIDFPGSHLGPTLLLHVPAGVHPPVVDLEPFFQVTIDVHDLVGLVGADHLLVRARTGGDELRRRELAPGLGHAVGHHPAAPNVLGADAVPLPELEHDQRAADLLSRQELESGQLLSGANANPAAFVASELGRPLSRPADDHDHALVGPLEVEIGQVGVGGTTSMG